ncbi:MAG: SMC-Scp complex subunit ScpB [Steroidobacteraceae bacterium]
MNTDYTRKVVEAALLAAGRSLTLAELSQLFDQVDRPETEQLRAALEELGASLEGRGIELLETASGFRVQVRREVSEQVSRLWPERPPRYSRALLETLSIIAYRQPLTRAGDRVHPRGGGDATSSRRCSSASGFAWWGTARCRGDPELLGTTRDFLDYFGLKRLDRSCRHWRT